MDEAFQLSMFRLLVQGVHGGDGLNYERHGGKWMWQTIAGEITNRSHGWTSDSESYRFAMRSPSFGQWQQATLPVLVAEGIHDEAGNASRATIRSYWRNYVTCKSKPDSPLKLMDTFFDDSMIR